MGTHIQLKPLGYICRRENSIAGSSSLMTQAGYSGEVARLEETEIQFHHEAISKKKSTELLPMLSQASSLLHSPQDYTLHTSDIPVNFLKVIDFATISQVG